MGVLNPSFVLIPCHKLLRDHLNPCLDSKCYVATCANTGTRCTQTLSEIYFSLAAVVGRKAIEAIVYAFVSYAYKCPQMQSDIMLFLRPIHSQFCML